MGEHRRTGTLNWVDEHDRYGLSNKERGPAGGEFRLGEWWLSFRLGGVWLDIMCVPGFF